MAVLYSHSQLYTLTKSGNFWFLLQAFFSKLINYWSIIHTHKHTHTHTHTGINVNKTTWVGTTSFMSSQSFSRLITVNLNLHFNGIKIVKQCSDIDFVKSVLIWGWSGPYYGTFWVNMGTYSVSLHIHSNCRKKVPPGKCSEHGHFPHSSQVLWFIILNLFFVSALRDKLISLI